MKKLNKKELKQLRKMQTMAGLHYHKSINPFFNCTNPHEWGDAINTKTGEIKPGFILNHSPEWLIPGWEIRKEPYGTFIVPKGKKSRVLLEDIEPSEVIEYTTGGGEHRKIAHYDVAPCNVYYFDGKGIVCLPEGKNKKVVHMNSTTTTTTIAIIGRKTAYEEYIQREFI